MVYTELQVVSSANLLRKVLRMPKESKIQSVPEFSFLSGEQNIPDDSCVATSELNGIKAVKPQAKKTVQWKYFDLIAEGRYRLRRPGRLTRTGMRFVSKPRVLRLADGGKTLLRFATFARLGVSLSERWLSGLRRTPGKREYLNSTVGSNPSLSARISPSLFAVIPFSCQKNGRRLRRCPAPADRHSNMAAACNPRYSMGEKATPRARD